MYGSASQTSQEKVMKPEMTMTTHFRHVCQNQTSRQVLQELGMRLSLQMICNCDCLLITLIQALDECLAQVCTIGGESTETLLKALAGADYPPDWVLPMSRNFLIAVNTLECVHSAFIAGDGTVVMPQVTQDGYPVAKALAVRLVASLPTPDDSTPPLQG